MEGAGWTRRLDMAKQKVGSPQAAFHSNLSREPDCFPQPSLRKVSWTHHPCLCQTFLLAVKQDRVRQILLRSQSVCIW